MSKNIYTKKSILNLSLLLIVNFNMLLLTDKNALANNNANKNLTQQSVHNVQTLQNPQKSIQIQIMNPWVRATVSQQKQSGAFFSLISNQDLELIEAYIPIASRTELHSMTMQNNTMLMQKVEKVSIIKNKLVKLTGDYHLMLFGLQQTLKINDSIPIKLTFIDKNQHKFFYEFNAIIKPIYYIDK